MELAKSAGINSREITSTKPGNGHHSMADWSELFDEDQCPLIHKRCRHH